MQTCNGQASLGLENAFMYVSLVGIQIAFAVLGVLMKDQLSKGTNPLALAAYSNAFGALLLSPFAIFFEKGNRSAMCFPLVLRLVLLSLGGICAFQTLLLMGLKETSPSFASAMPNLAPAMIFVMAWCFGMEKVDVKCAHSQFKLAGTVISVCGAMVMSFLRGPVLSQLWPSPLHSNSQNILHSFLHEGNSETRIKGCIYLISAVMILSSTMILQAETLKIYPATLSVATIVAALGSFQIAILSTILDKGFHKTTWILDWSGFLTVNYGGTVCHAIALALQLWCIKRRGPVFVATFSPVNTICSALISSFFLGETLHLASVMGALLIFCGLYMVLWGKGKESPTEEEILSDEEKQLQNKQVEVDLLHEGFVDVKTPLLQQGQICYRSEKIF